MAWRAYIRVSDRTTADGFVIGGIDGTDHMGQRLSHLLADVWCPACKTHGVIIPDGDRPNDDWTGQKPALSFDICKCKCDPPPRLIASDWGMQVWVEPANGVAPTSATATEETWKHGNGASTALAAYDERITLRDSSGSPLVDTPYTVRLASGELAHGITDSTGRTSRYSTNGARPIDFYIGHRVKFR